MKHLRYSLHLHICMRLQALLNQELLLLRYFDIEPQHRFYRQQGILYRRRRPLELLGYLNQN